MLLASTAVAPVMMHCDVVPYIDYLTVWDVEPIVTQQIS